VLTGPDGIKYEIVSPAESAEKADLNRIIGRIKDGVPAPPCKDDGQTCTPWDRKWAGSGLKPLPGGTVDALGKMVGPYQYYDSDRFEEREAAFRYEMRTMILAALIPPALLGVMLLGGSWVIAGFRESSRQQS
jgi:hypothetical protein